MTAPELLHEIEARGVALRVEAGALKLRPAAALDARVLAEIRIAKPAIIALLRDRDASREYSRVAASQKPTPAASLFDDGESYAAPDAPASALRACATAAPKAAARQSLAREVAAARVFGAWCNPTPRVLAAWREAEAATEMPLTLSGTPRRKFSNEENAGALYDAALATAEAHRAFDAGEVTAAQRDTLLRYASGAA